MQRDVAKLSDRVFDVVIVGAGAYGAFAAWEAARCGLSVALVDRGDFAGATSSNSLRTVHGGLRYLQHLDLRRMRETIRERRTLMQLAPHLIEPMPFLLPTFGHGLRGPEVLRMALLLNDAISCDRNRGVNPAIRLPPGRVLSRAAAAGLFKGLDIAGYNGAALWYDGFNHCPERLILEMVLRACTAGAEAANHMRVDRLLVSNQRVAGVAATDVLEGCEIEIRSRTVLNAAGPWVDDVLGARERLAGGRLFHPSKAVNLVVRRLPFDHAIGIPIPRRGRHSDLVFDKGTKTYFVLPWGRFSLIGTKHLRYSGSADEFAVCSEDVTDFMEELYPVVGRHRASVYAIVAVHGGMLPEQPSGDPEGEVALQKHPLIVNHGKSGGPHGLVSMVGVKWTTARRVAESAVTALRACLGSRVEGGTRTAAVAAVDRANDMNSCASQGRRDSDAYLHRMYGAGAADVLALARNHPDQAKPLVSDSPVMGVQLLHAIRTEMAVTLADVIRLRTELWLSDELNDSALAACASLMARELHWSGERMMREIDHARKALGQLRGSQLRAHGPDAHPAAIGGRTGCDDTQVAP